MSLANIPKMSIVEMVPDVLADICQDGRANFFLEVFQRAFVVFSNPEHLNKHFEQLRLILEMKIVNITSVDLHFVALVFLEDLYQFSPTEA